MSHNDFFKNIYLHTAGLRCSQTTTELLMIQSDTNYRTSGLVFLNFFLLVTMGSNDELVKLWLSADAVCFDVDSTLCKEEAIDELAKFCGVGEEIRKCTIEAMNGNISFQDALRTRLNIIKPSKSILKQFIETHPPKLTDGVKDLILILQKKNIDIYLISGGFRTIIETVAKEVNIPKDHIFANRLQFDQDGNYVSFDKAELTAKSGGKGQVIQLLKDKHNYSNLIMIGDGATDMEASPPADAFIGFGGNVVRKKVKEEAKWFVMSFAELTNVFKNGSNNMEV
ncbi:phosphoserine phosphatase isoform X1 [Octopus sinensis]|uniref:Phosphoserine phosphatase n=2 Tax=Octopus sinensis TaxID=2607531 RepID=A0A6P7SZR7_9MOLL|nr:phosphoserine phosphatase isoform X1 [Octopus sinensis]